LSDEPGFHVSESPVCIDEHQTIKPGDRRSEVDRRVELILARDPMKEMDASCPPAQPMSCPRNPRSQASTFILVGGRSYDVFGDAS
jgi:hypothetical protein